MTRMIRGSVLLAACVGLWSCSSDPTADEAGVPVKVIASPTVVFVKQDSSELVEFGLVDALNGDVPATWTITSSSPNFTVAFDSSYRPVYNTDGTLTLPDSQTEVRATITGTALGISSFTVSGGGQSLVIPVNVIPGTLYATFTPATPAPGDTVTMTMPANTLLSQTSAVTFPGNLNPIIVDRAADSTSLRFINAPTTDTTAVVTKVYYTITNGQFGAQPAVTLTSQSKVTGTQSGTWTGQLPVTISNLTPGAAPITATLDAPYAFSVTPASAFSFPTQTAPILNGFSADSGTATITVGPNVASPLQGTLVRFRGAPQFQYTLASADSVISTILIPNVPATFTPENPQVGDTVTITAGAGFTFGNSSVTWPLGATAIVAGLTANTIRVLPQPGSSGVPTITLVTSSAAPLFPLTLATFGPDTLTMQATSIYGGRGNPATATQLTIPPVATDTLEFFDLSQNIDQFYGITLAAAPVTLAVRLSWPGGSDVDMLFCNAACTAFAPTPAVFGGATGANPENATVPYTMAGAYNLWINLYDGAPPGWMRVRIIRILY